MNGAHEPTPEFRAFLESEIARTLRLESRDVSPARFGRRQRLRTAALFVGALALGALAGAAPTQVQDARHREQLMAATQADLQLAAMRLELARTAFDDAKRKFDVGVIGSAALAAAEAELRSEERDVARIRLNQEEIQLTSAPPRDDIAAPIAGSRDFASERLRLDMAAAQQRLRSLESALDEVERRHRVGAASPVALLDAQVEVARANGELRLLASRFGLRREFLEDDISLQQVETRLQRLELMHEADLVRRLHSLSEARLTNLRRLRELGTVEQLEVMRAEVEMLERSMELQRIGRQLQMLNRGQEGAPPDSGGSS
jgi:hypothetical protein